MLSESLAFVAAVVLGLTFVVSGIGKLRDPQGFVLGVLEYDLLARPLAVAYGRLLPFAELLCGTALLLGAWPALSGLLAATLLLSFLTAASITLARGRQVDCHCFGSQDSEPLGRLTVVRLLVLLACAAAVAGTGRGGFLAASPTEPTPTLLLALGVLLGLYLLRAAPAVARVWRARGAPAPTRHGSRVNLRGLPLLPIGVVLNDRTREVSGCGACRDRGPSRDPWWVVRWLPIRGRGVSG